MKKTIVVLSGGLDSTTLLYDILWQLPKGVEPKDHVKAISFNYGQRHSKEILLARETCQKLGIEHKIVDLKNITELFGDSSLTDSTKEVPEGHYEDENMKDTVVPNRNAIMANIAIAWAISSKFERVALGVHAGDHAIYPDCRPVFIKTLSVLAEIVDYEPIEIYAPYLEFSKIDIVSRGLDLNVVYKLTWTCYKGLDKACGKCGSCVERLEAFKENKAIDPILYE